MPLDSPQAVYPPPVGRPVGRRWSIGASEYRTTRPTGGMRHSHTTGHLRHKAHAMSLSASPQSSPSTPTSEIGTPSPHSLEAAVGKAFSDRNGAQALFLPESPADKGMGREKAPPNCRMGRRSSAGTLLPNPSQGRAMFPTATKNGTLHGSDPTEGHVTTRRARTLSLHDDPLKGDVDVFHSRPKQNALFKRTGPDFDSTHADDEKGRQASMLPAIPSRGITSAGRTRTQPKHLSATRPHTTAGTTRKRSAENNNITVKIPGLIDLHPDAVIHEVVTTLANMQLEIDLRGPLAVQGNWHECPFLITVHDEDGFCSLRFERLSGGTAASFQEAFSSICDALERNAAGY